MKNMKSKTDTRIPFFQSFNCSIDWKLNKILKECLKHKIKCIYERGHFFFEVEFSDMTHYEFWNCNRWDGWLMYGRFWRIFDSDEHSLYRYSGKRPTRRTMRKLLNQLNKYHNERTKENELK
jgi:hypothetical protein